MLSIIILEDLYRSEYFFLASLWLIFNSLFSESKVSRPRAVPLSKLLKFFFLRLAIFDEIGQVDSHNSDEGRHHRERSARTVLRQSRLDTCPLDIPGSAVQTYRQKILASTQDRCPRKQRRTDREGRFYRSRRSCTGEHVTHTPAEAPPHASRLMPLAHASHGLQLRALVSF